ncbi:MAG: phage baseplate assembly protein V, partial [Mangrovicoccus sp.]
MQLSYGAVVNISHPDAAFAVEVKLHGHGEEETLWARVLSPVAGNDYGMV